MAVALLLAGGCGLGRSDEAERFCRLLIPAFNESRARIELLSSSARAGSSEVLVSLRYRVTGAGDARERALLCRMEFSPDRILPKLHGLATESGPLGDIRLYLLQRTWIDSGAVGTSDPAMVVLLPIAPKVPHWLAVVLQTAISALPSIAIYGVLATAYALLYGLIGRINLAFGEIAILGGYATFLAGTSVGGFAANPFGIAVAAAAGLLTAGVWGLALGVLVVAPLAHRPGRHILIATLGASIAISELLRLTQGAGGKWMPPILNQPYGIADAPDHPVTVTPMSLLVTAGAFAAATALVWAMDRTAFGRRWRAASDDAFAARLLGVDANRLTVQTAILSAFVAGLAGVLTALSYGGVGHSGGLGLGLKALLAAVLGGLGSVRGAFLGGLMIGIAEAAWAAAVSIESRDVALFALLAAAIIWRRVDEPPGPAR